MKAKQLKPWSIDGRPQKYSQVSFDKKVKEYLQLRKHKEKWPVTMLDFCCYADIHKEFLSDHDRQDGSPYDFSDSIKTLRVEAERSLEYFGLLGKLNPAVTIFCLKNNFKWKDRQEITGAEGTPLQAVQVEIITSNKNENTGLTSIQ